MMIFNIIKANKELKQLAEDKLELVKQMEVLKKDLTDVQDTIGNFMVEKQTYEKQMADLKESHTVELANLTNKFTAEINELNTSIINEKNSSARKAQNSVASIGVLETEIKVTPNELLASSMNKKNKYTVIDHSVKNK